MITSHFPTESRTTCLRNYHWRLVIETEAKQQQRFKSIIKAKNKPKTRLCANEVGDNQSALNRS